MTTFSLEAALEAETRHAEVGVLVGELLVARVVGGFGDAPRHAEAGGVVDLPPHDQAVGLLEQAAERRAHDQRRHQILEHRARPRDQRRAAPDRRHRAAQPEPVAGRHLALGDREEAGEPRFRGQQVVAAGVETYPRQRDSRSTAACARGSRRKSNSMAATRARVVTSMVCSRRSSAALASASCATSRRWLAIDRCTASTQNSTSSLAASARSLASARARSAALPAPAARSSSPSGSRSSAAATIVERTDQLLRRDEVRAPVVGQRLQGLARERQAVAHAGSRSPPHRRGLGAMPRRHWRARSDARPDCRCRPRRCRADRAACRSVVSYQLQKWPRNRCSVPSSPTSPPAARRPRSCRSNRSRGRRPSTAAEGRYWSATSGGRRRRWDPPGNCPAAACCRPR